MNKAFFCTSYLLVFVSCLALGALSPAPASADGLLTEVTWAHPTPERVSRFVIVVSPTDSTSADTRWVDVGKPTGEASGWMSVYTALVPLSGEEYVAIAAIGTNGLLSSMSSWSVVTPSRPGQPIVVK